MHDNTVDRTMEGTGEVPHLTLAQVHQLKYKQITTQEYVIKDPRNKSIESEDARQKQTGPVRSARCALKLMHSCACLSVPARSVSLVPTLEQVILFCRERHLKLMIETKEYTWPHLLREKIAALYEKYDMYDFSFTASFNPLHLYYYRRDHPTIPICLLYCRTCTEWYNEDASQEMLLPAMLNYESVRRAFDWVLWYFSPTLLADWLGVSMVGPHNILVSPALLSSLTTRGIVCDVWTVNAELEKQWLLSLGCIVTTDRLFSHADVSPFADAEALPPRLRAAMSAPALHTRRKLARQQQLLPAPPQLRARQPRNQQ